MHFLLAGLLAGLLGPSEQQTAAWASIYAPIIIHDSQEPAPLTSVQALLATGPTLQGRCTDGQLQRQQVHSPEALLQASQALARADCLQDQALHFNKVIPAAEAVAYYHLRSEARFVTLQYWLFYTWNETGHLGGGPLVASCADHEGDWEHISLRLNRSRLEAAQSPADYRAAIDDIYLAGHARGNHRSWKYRRPNDPLLRFEGPRLTVFPSRGNHASYPAPGRWPLMTLAGLALADVSDGKGLRLDLNKGQLLPVTKTPWFGFAGRWGAVQNDHCNALESLTEASNDGAFGPGHAHKERILYDGDWSDHFRPSFAAGQP